MVVSLPSGNGKAEVFVDGLAVPAKVARGSARFILPAAAGRAVDWAVVRG
jgi:hypothetical protein